MAGVTSLLIRVRRLIPDVFYQEVAIEVFELVGIKNAVDQSTSLEEALSFRVSDRHVWQVSQELDDGMEGKLVVAGSTLYAILSQEEICGHNDQCIASARVYRRYR